MVNKIHSSTLEAVHTYTCVETLFRMNSPHYCKSIYNKSQNFIIYVAISAASHRRILEQMHLVV